MKFNDRIKTFQRALARFGLYFFHWLFARLPFGVVHALAFVLIKIGFVFTIKQKNVARESLNVAFGQEQSVSEIEKIVRDCFENLGQGVVEMIYFLSHPDEVAGHVTIEGKEYLDEALAQGKGVVAVTAHFGNFPLMMLYFARQKFKTNAIIRPARDKKIEKFLFDKRTEVGLNTIYAVPRQQCVVNSLKVLRNNEILFIPIDQNFGSDGGVFVNFFGQKAATATGPVVFATRTNAPILPMFTIREKNNNHKIIIEPSIDLHVGESEQETLLKNTEKITKLIERYIRKYPHEWGWMHRRWKSQPNLKRNKRRKKEVGI